MANNYITIFEGTDLNVGAREVTEPDGILKRHQTAVIASGVLELPTTPQIQNVNALGDYPTDPINIAGYGSIIIKSEFDTNGDSCGIKIVLYLSDGSTIIGETDEIVVNATNRVIGSNYLGTVTVFDNSKVGASYIKINLTTAPSGHVSFYIGGI